jgi:16S rRNA (uracil1498-N3)-methyltransferase
MVWPRKNIHAEYTQPVPARFYVPEARDEASSIELPQDEAAHVTRVLRLSSGDRIRVFNGRGQEWDAVIDHVSRQRVTARLTSPVHPGTEPRTAVTLAVAVLKGDKMDDIVRDAVMLGVTAIQPLLTTRTEIAAAAIEKSGRIARWQRIAVSSAKQCGRAVVPDVRPAMSFEDALSAAPQQTEQTVMLVEPSAAGDAKTLRDVPHVDRITLVIGPEGGWTEQEVQRAVGRGTMLLTLGSQTLRADAVPLVALTALRVRLEDF